MFGVSQISMCEYAVVAVFIKSIVAIGKRYVGMTYGLNFIGSVFARLYE
jgi:hypothetical protein